MAMAATVSGAMLESPATSSDDSPGGVDAIEQAREKDPKSWAAPLVAAKLASPAESAEESKRMEAIDELGMLRASPEFQNFFGFRFATSASRGMQCTPGQQRPRSLARS